MQEEFVSLLTGNATVAALTGGGHRIWWGVARQGYDGPLVVLNLISGVPDYHMAGPSGMEESRVQVDCRASTLAAAKSLADAIDTVLGGYAGTVGAIRFSPILRIARRGGFEKTEAEKFHFVSDDYQVFSGRAA